MLYDRDKFLVIFPRGNKSPIEESRSIYAGRRDEGTSFPWRWNSREFSTSTKLYQYVFLSSSVKVSRNERFTNVYRSMSRDEGNSVRRIAINILKLSRGSFCFFEKNLKVLLVLSSLVKRILRDSCQLCTLYLKKQKNNLFVLKQIC